MVANTPTQNDSPCPTCESSDAPISDTLGTFFGCTRNEKPKKSWLAFHSRIELPG
jgi:hypothetical protein